MFGVAFIEGTFFVLFTSSYIVQYQIKDEGGMSSAETTSNPTVSYLGLILILTVLAMSLDSNYRWRLRSKSGI